MRRMECYVEMNNLLPLLGALFLDIKGALCRPGGLCIYNCLSIQFADDSNFL
ncbi:hypothetical protein ALC53_13418 [Atta colombica]|uniref:Uncharacterized protein n=1 Tax=Atta colombica TaxID=520822 RepID=A0A195AVS2_9HYME|nr:hypothetical protein ALC53_13418 [Atta colombica]